MGDDLARWFFYCNTINTTLKLFATVVLRRSLVEVVRDLRSTDRSATHGFGYIRSMSESPRLGVPLQ